jgi:hypothetical protein
MLNIHRERAICEVRARAAEIGLDIDIMHTNILKIRGLDSKFKINCIEAEL